MTEVAGGSFDFGAVDLGPEPSDAAKAGAEAETAESEAPPSIEALRARFGEGVRRHAVYAGDQCVAWIDPARNLEVLGWLRDDPEQAFDMMTDVTAVDYGGGAPINVVYQMYSTGRRQALRVRCELPLEDLAIDSVTGLWSSANWLEREVYDLFGVTFRGHPDPRRILMPENYAEGHPLRKDFPLRGRFSRAEQTARALNQDLESFYDESDLEAGGDPQLMETKEEAGAGVIASPPQVASPGRGA